MASHPWPRTAYRLQAPGFKRKLSRFGQARALVHNAETTPPSPLSRLNEMRVKQFTIQVLTVVGAGTSCIAGLCLLPASQSLRCSEGW